MIVAVPNAPRLFSVLAINSSAVLLTWRRLSERDARGVIRGYYFHQSEIGPGGNRIGEPKVIIVSICNSLRRLFLLGGHTLYYSSLEIYL